MSRVDPIQGVGQKSENFFMLQQREIQRIQLNRGGKEDVQKYATLEEVLQTIVRFEQNWVEQGEIC